MNNITLNPLGEVELNDGQSYLFVTNKSNVLRYGMWCSFDQRMKSAAFLKNINPKTGPWSLINGGECPKKEIRALISVDKILIKIL